MKKTTMPSYFDSLRNRIDITRVPFSDRGSRLLVFKYPDADRLYVKLAERLTAVQPGLETYLFRPPYIQDLCFIDEEGMPLTYHLTIYICQVRAFSPITHTHLRCLSNHRNKSLVMIRNAFKGPSQ